MPIIIAKQLAQRWSVSERTIQGWTSKGLIPAYGRNPLRFDVAEVERVAEGWSRTPPRQRAGNPGAGNAEKTNSVGHGNESPGNPGVGNLGAGDPVPWSTWGNADVPPGIYRVRFLGVEEVPSSNNSQGKSWRWRWGISAGPYRGKILSRMTAMSPRENNAPGRLARQLTRAVEGSPLPASQFAPVLYEGEPMRVRLEAREDGPPIVTEILPLKAVRVPGKEL